MRFYEAKLIGGPRCGVELSIPIPDKLDTPLRVITVAGHNSLYPYQFESAIEWSSGLKRVIYTCSGEERFERNGTLETEGFKKEL